MISWESSTFIARPAGEVFAYVADVRNDPNWHLDVKSATVIRGNGQLGEGTVFDVKARVSGTEQIITWEPPHEVVLKFGDTEKMTSIDTRTVTPVEGGVTFTRHVDLEASGFMGWMTKMMINSVTKRNDRFVANLKEALEAS